MAARRSYPSALREVARDRFTRRVIQEAARRARKERMRSSTTLADAIGHMTTDPSLRQAWLADPWLALACVDLANGASLAGIWQRSR
jgi:hypothetical protein